MLEQSVSQPSAAVNCKPFEMCSPQLRLVPGRVPAVPRAGLVTKNEKGRGSCSKEARIEIYYVVVN